MNRRGNGKTTEQPEWNFENANRNIRINYAFVGNGIFGHWRDVIKESIIKIVGGDGESIPVFKLVPTIRAEIQDVLNVRGLECVFENGELVIIKIHEDRSDEYDARYRAGA